VDSSCHQLRGSSCKLVLSAHEECQYVLACRLTLLNDHTFTSQVYHGECNRQSPRLPDTCECEHRNRWHAARGMLALPVPRAPLTIANSTTKCTARTHARTHTHVHTHTLIPTNHVSRARSNNRCTCTPIRLYFSSWKAAFERLWTMPTLPSFSAVVGNPLLILPDHYQCLYSLGRCADPHDKASPLSIRMTAIVFLHPYHRRHRGLLQLGQLLQRRYLSTP
jgi:hypothetical protein